MSFSAGSDPGVVAAYSALSTVEVQLVFEPAWSPEKMSDDARFLLGAYSR